MAGRPRHEALRGHVTELLREGFGAPYDEIAHELYLLDNSGRIDTMWGATVIELKSDLRRELADVEARMPAYLADAARRSGNPRPVTGIATDGATMIGYQLVDGALQELRRYTTDPARPGEDLAASAARAESVAASVPLTDGQHFTAKRRAIRIALAEDGVAAEIEAMVDALLPP